MANVRQMPALIIRGAVAKITMPSLTLEEQAKVEEMTKMIADHPEMAKHRTKMIEKFGVTIAADYADDRLIADQEYLIAVWRGVVELFYHHKYTFKCTACESTTYRTGRGSAKPIDHIQLQCPNCHQVKVSKSGDTNLRVGEYVTHELFQESYENMTDSDEKSGRQPECVSPIIAIKGEKKYDDPQRIIENAGEMKKFFGEFVWNYFRQHIAENKRTTHGTKPKEFMDRADTVAANEIAALCVRMRVGHSFEFKELSSGKYTIIVSGLQTPPEFTDELFLIRRRAAQFGVQMELTNQAICIPVDTALPLVPTQTVMPERAKVLDNNTCIAGEEPVSVIGQLDYRSVGGARMDQDDHVGFVDNNDALEEVRKTLPEGDCRRIYDVMRQEGEEFARYRDKYGDGVAKINHLAAFFGINAKTVKTHQSTIRVTLLAADFITA